MQQHELQFHIQCKEGDVGRYCILPGDPGRCEKIAAYFDDPVKVYSNREHTVYFENHKKPTLTIQKVDSITGSPIEGAKFQVWYGSNDTETGELDDLGTYFTGANGQIVLEDLRDGWYRVTELEPAPGFTIREPATQEFYIQGGESKTVTFQNVPLSAIAKEDQTK